MTRSMLSCCGILFAVVFVLLKGTEMAQAQTARIDQIRFMGATRGNNVDNDDHSEFCISKNGGWHIGWSIAGVYGPPNGLDLLAQWPASTTWPNKASWQNNCNSKPEDIGRVEPVDLWAYGLTDKPTCTMAAPCPSLIARTLSGTTGTKCTIIEAWLYDHETWPVNGNLIGDLKGKQRMLHATGASGVEVIIFAAENGWYLSQREIGRIVKDDLCTKKTDGTPGWTGYHVHQDYQPGVDSDNCRWSWNTALIGSSTEHTPNFERQNLVHWVHSLRHKWGAACLVPGQKSADHLMRIGGELDGPTPNSGQGARSLTTGATLTTSSTCIEGTSWCGTMTVTQPLLRAAKSYDQGWPPSVYLKGQQQSLPPKGADRYWYGHDAQGYVFWVRFDDVNPRDRVISCSDLVYAGERLYYLNFRSSANITCPNGQAWDGAGTPTTYRVAQRHISYIWSQFRGMNGINPSSPPTQEDANAWAQSWIDTGHWLNVVKPAIDAVIRAAVSIRDMTTLGITGNPSFDLDLVVDVEEAINGRDFRALGVTEPLLHTRVLDELNHDWIMTSRSRWRPDLGGRKVFPR